MRKRDPTAARRRGGGSSGIPTGLRKALREEGDVSREGEGGARAWGLADLPFPHIYRGKGEGGAALALPPRKGAAKGGRSPSSPRHLGGAFPL